MYKKRHILFCLTFCLTLIGYSQGKLDVVKNVIQSGDYEKAKELITEMVNDSSFNTRPDVWFWDGYITKNLYKKSEKGNAKSPLRLEAIASIRKSKAFDTDSSELAPQRKAIIKYLSQTIYNDVVRSIAPSGSVGSVSDASLDVAAENFQLYTELKKELTPNVNLTKKEIQFNLVMGQNYMKKFESEGDRNRSYFEKAEKQFSAIIKLDSNHFKANYNIAILHYNDAVYIINNMDYDADIDQLNENIELSSKMFLTALPYMIRAHHLDPNKKEALKGLSGIYWSLNEPERSELYKKEYEKMMDNSEND